ncbi:hypothetical protein H206_06249 [Candidatus Electrothrix aarhusensis]|uniref:Uncharacterized protein n=1 Tax=Candidatus Electrothrix aarhusensis TaxID=1859131 RepID=A0A3S3R9Q9_9BACT|nr:hypothetical protein H206_06249 [Candidatus Electrothrix aarhusensis]
MVTTYKFSTFVLAQGVFRRNLRLEFSVGFIIKHRILVQSPNLSQP